MPLNSKLSQYIPPSMDTPEKKRKYLQQINFGDTEFEADVRSRIGPLADQMKINARIAKYQGTLHANRLERKGQYLPTPQDRKNLGWGKQESPYATSYPYNEAGDERVYDAQSGTVEAFGIHGVPTVWAHEYKHKGYLNTFADEKRLKEHDAFSATNKGQWDELIRLIQGENETIEEADARMTRQIKGGRDQAAWEYRQGARIRPGGSLKEYTRERNQQSYIMRELGVK